MAIEILPQRVGWGETLGKSLGQAISGGIEGLVQGKLQQMTHQRNIRELGEAFPTLSKEEVNFLARQEPQQQLKYLQSFGRAQQGQEGAQPSSALQQLQGQQPEQMQDQQQQQRPFAYQNLSTEQQATLKKALANPEITKNYAPEVLKGLQNFIAKEEAKPARSNVASQLQQAVKPTQLAPQQQAQQQGPSAPQRKSLLQALGAPTMQEAAKQEELGLKKEELALKKQEILRKTKSEAFRETKEERKKIHENKKAAKEGLEAVERFEELEEEGLPSAGMMEFYKNAGLDIPALIGAPAEEYNKIAANFLRGAKAVFGARITDVDLENFLKTIPSLSNSPEGRKRINANLKRMYRLQVAEADAYEEILKENDGIPPLDLSSEIDKRVDKKRDAYAKKFKMDLAKQVPAGESAIATAALSATGKLVGNIPKALKGAGQGAIAGAVSGRYGGPVGMFGGAALGGLAGLLGYNASIKDIL